MKNGVLTFITGLLVGAIIATGGFLLYSKNTKNEAEQININMVQRDKMERIKRSSDANSTDFDDLPEIPENMDGEELPEMPNGEEPPAKPDDSEKNDIGRPTSNNTQNPPVKPGESSNNTNE